MKFMNLNKRTQISQIKQVKHGQTCQTNTTTVPKINQINQINQQNANNPGKSGKIDIFMIKAKISKIAKHHQTMPRPPIADFWHHLWNTWPCTAAFFVHSQASR